jgi:two-component system, LytTR family, sensor histidine kinase AlgZ
VVAALMVQSSRTPCALKCQYYSGNRLKSRRHKLNSDLLELNKARRHWLPDLCRTEALFWVALLSVVLAIILELLMRGANFSLVNFGQRALLILWMVLIGCMLACYIRRISMDWPLWSVVASVMLGIQFAGFLGAWGQMLVTGESLIDALVPSQLLSALIGSVSLRFFYLQYQERLRAERLKQAEFELLQARIQPHFLFNTLNSIASLIATKPDQAENAVLDLADLMRSSLNAGQKLIPLSEELELCEKYLQIESLRMGERLKWDFSVDTDAKQVNIPSLSLQPLIENAVLHGISQLPKGGTIEFKAKFEARLESKNGASDEYESDRLLITVINPIAEDSVHGGNQIALKNVAERLQASSTHPVTLSSSIVSDHYHLEICIVLDEKLK